MSFEEEFDKIIKQKADEAEFPFDEKNWENLSKQLDSERKVGGVFTKRILMTTLVLSVLLTLLVVGLKNSKTSDSDLISDIKSAEVIEVLHNGKKQAQNAASESAQEKKMSEDEHSSTNTKSLNSPNPSGVTRALSLTTNGSMVTQMNMRKNLSKSLENKTSENNLPNLEQDKDATSSSSAASDPTMPTGSTIAANNFESSPTAAALPSYQIFEFVYLKPRIIGMPATADEKDVALNSISVNRNFDQDYYKAKKNKFHFMNLEAGTTYLSGWQTPRGNDGKGFNWFVGINYGIYLSRKLAISAGVQSYNVTNIAQPFYSGTSTEYGFSSVSSHTIITSRALYYAAVPIRVSYSLNAFNQFGLGFNFGLLMNANNTIQTYRSSPETGISSINNGKKTGIYPGIAPTVMLLSAFYKTNINNRLALNGELIYGLTDLFDNTKNNTNIENTMGLRLSLQFKLFDK